MTRPVDDAALLVGALDVVPDLHLLGFFLGEDDVAFLVLGLLEEHVDGVAGLDGDLAGLVAELVEGDDPLGLVADVDDDLGLRDLQHDAPHDLAFGEVLEADVVHVEEAFVLLGVEGVSFTGFVRASWPDARRGGGGGGRSDFSVSGMIVRNLQGLDCPGRRRP